MSRFDTVEFHDRNDPRNPREHICPICGFKWKHGFPGNHTCSDYMFSPIKPMWCVVELKNRDLNDVSNFKITYNAFHKVHGPFKTEKEAENYVDNVKDQYSKNTLFDVQEIEKPFEGLDKTLS